MLHWNLFFFMGVRLVSEVWVLVVRGLVFICFYSVDLLVSIGSLVGGWLASLVSWGMELMEGFLAVLWLFIYFVCLEVALLEEGAS
jgi:hypothetical protein